MSTRGFVGFVADGQEKVTYNHSDSYPDWLGLNVYRFVAQLMKDGAVEEAAKRVRELTVVKESGPAPTPDQVAALRRWANTSVSTRDLTDWYVLLRETQGDPDAILTAGYLIDGSDFPLDSLFAEWGYVIDFDAKTLDVYRGFQKEPPAEGRWVGKEGREGYHPVNRIASYPFDQLPGSEASFVDRLNRLAGYEDE